MKPQCLIFSLLVLSVSYSNAQLNEALDEGKNMRKKAVSYSQTQFSETRTNQCDTGLIIQTASPCQWVNSTDATVIIINSKDKEKGVLNTVFFDGRDIPLDVSKFRGGVYILKMTINDPNDSIREVETAFIKTKKLKSVTWKLITYNELNGLNHLYHPQKKPVIYLYPQQAEDIAVKVNFKGNLTQTIPDYKQGWLVNAKPDGSITNYADGKEYPYLFWEGETSLQEWNMNEGFVVRADSTRQFLESILPRLGLIPKEYNEFIDFWLPQLQKNPYNLIHFSGSEYEQIAQLEITPKPDAELIVFMAFEPVNKNTRVHPQQFKPFIRKGFTVVEWGGTELENAAIKI